MAASTGILERGKACLRCRRRKMRCDGARPACGQCVRADRNEDCEYVDGQGLTPSQILEQEVVRLEGRIAELENTSSQPVLLHDPYANFNQGLNTPPAPPPAEQSQLPVQTVETLLGSFLPQASQVGFFLHVQRFLQKVFAAPTDGNPGHPPVLLNAVYLLGAKFSRDPQIRSQQPGFLSRALEHLPSAISLATAATIIPVLQAEILLSYYFLDSNRRLEGAYHSNAAVSIAMACKLNMIRSSRVVTTPGDNDVLGETDIRLLPPVDDVEEGERINAFWSAFILDKSWAVTLGSTSAFSDDESIGTHIDVPWPMDMADYENHRLHPNMRSVHTVKTFLDSAAGSVGRQSVLAMRAKAALLLERANRIASRWEPNNATFQARFLALDNRLEQFKQTVPPVARIDPVLSDAVRGVLTVHILCHCATIQLHTPMVQGFALNTRTLAAANAAVGVLRSMDVTRVDFVGSIMAGLLTTVADVILRTVNVVRSYSIPGMPGPAFVLPDEGALIAAVNDIATVMQRWGVLSTMMGQQHGIIGQAMAAM